MFAIPSLSDLTSRVRNAFRVEMPGSDANTWPNNLYPTAKVIGGSLFAVYLRLDYVAKQIFAATAEGAFLDRHAAEFGLGRLPAAPAIGNVTMTATAGASIAAGAVLQRPDGVRLVATATVSIPGAGSVAVPVAAAAAGKSGNTIAGTVLTAVAGVTGSPTFAVDAEGIATGADLEGDDALRARILFRKRNPPHGGAAADYVQWASAVPGVTRVYVERLWSGPGTVRVFPLTDGITANGIPTAATLQAVADTIEPTRPAGALVTVAAATAIPVDVTITGLAPNTATVREAILAELRDAFARLARVSGADQAVAGMPYLASGQTFSRSWLWQAVANATGEERHAITYPTADLAIPVGGIAVLGAVTFN